jgi:hypothetical protein
MSELSTRTVLHKRLSTFVDWIKPDSTKRQEIKDQADKIREKIKNKAMEKGITIKSTPYGGSFASKCGLRRHFRGNSEIEGLDVDLLFVTAEKTENSWSLNSLLDDFYKIVDSCYPDSEKKKTKSSIKLKFNSNLNFDIVPLLEGHDDESQILIRSNGEKIETSVSKHVNFIKSRTSKSQEESGRVNFNECLRLLKWWRETQANDSMFLGGDDSPPSFLINLLAAHAFDQVGLEMTYGETMAKWFGFLASTVRNESPVLFTDYNNPTEELYKWTVMDPVNTENNIVKSWSSVKKSELADWLEKGRDNWSRIVRYDLEGEDARSLDELVELFGTAFKNHCN